LGNCGGMLTICLSSAVGARCWLPSMSTFAVAG
jgi:hypothetical protein